MRQKLYRFKHNGIREVHAKHLGQAVSKIIAAYPETKPLSVVSLEITEIKSL